MSILAFIIITTFLLTASAEIPMPVKIAAEFRSVVGKVTEHVVAACVAREHPLAHDSFVLS